MADDYSPPISPSINFVFSGVTYAPPISPSINFVFGDDGGGADAGLLTANYMILLTM